MERKGTAFFNKNNNRQKKNRNMTGQNEKNQF
jgi:hypothetical protein